jgi:nucleoside-diphosphate-sugar epimerase
MTVLVTGAGGFLGRAVVRRLLAHDGTDVRCLVRSPAQAEHLQQMAHAGSRAACVVGDLRTPGVPERAVEGADVVCHLAATMKGAFSDMVMGTVVASKYLLEAIARARPSVRLVLVSSFSVYGTAGLPAGTRIDEQTMLEPHPTWRGGYCYSKLRQEELFRDFARASDSPLVILRPGVVYGPRGPAFSPRVGVQLPGLFLHVGRDNVIPFTYVDNCAEAVAVAARHDEGRERVCNVVDDELMTAREYLRAYRRHVAPIRYITIPYTAMRVIAGWVEAYHHRSGGQLPAFFTRYKADTNWKGFRYTNERLRSIGWKPIVSADEAMRLTFEDLRRSAGA